MIKLLIPVERITITGNRRAIDDLKVTELAGSIRQIGLINPITVRPDQTDAYNYFLVAGLHRLEAFKLLGAPKIEAKLIAKNDLETELIEIDENLIRNELHYTERGELLRRKKEIYEELYPETKAGIAGGKASGEVRRTKTESDFVQQTPKKAESDLSLKPSFVTDTARKTGRSETVIKEELQIANKIIPEANQILKNKEIPKTEAVKLAREEPEIQKKIVPLFETGQTKKVEEAKMILSPAEQQYQDRLKEIDRKHENHKLVSDLINNMKFIKIDEKAVEDYMKIAIDIFQEEFMQNCDRLINKLNEMKIYYSNITKIRRVK